MSKLPEGSRSRRAFVGGLTASAAAFATGCATRKQTVKPAPSPPDSTAGTGSLREHAAAHGFLYGCAVDINSMRRDDGYATLVHEQAAIVVAENAMKWAPMRPSIDTWFFDDADWLVAFAEARHTKVRGHNLCWHRQLPKWFASEATVANARGLLVAHVERVVSRYAGRMHSWDVVNEAVHVGDGRGDGLRDSPWLRLVGEDYIEQTFRAARNADPQALLAYNEYGIEGSDPGSEQKRAAVLTLLRRLKARNVPVDALGIQSHITAGHSYGLGLVNFMAAVRGLGLQIFITEMDVNDRLWPANEAIRDKVVAESYGSYLDLVLREPAVRVVMTWGITDRRTWLNGEDARADHLPERCLPFGLKDGVRDAPKEAFFTMRNSFDRRPTTPAPRGL